MASGCIISMSCYACGEIVWDDDWNMHGDVFIHEGCKAAAVAKDMRLEKYQVIKLSKLEEIKLELETLKSYKKYFDDEISRVEEMILQFEKGEDK